jgi:hypothetical protein
MRYVEEAVISHREPGPKTALLYMYFDKSDSGTIVAKNHEKAEQYRPNVASFCDNLTRKNATIWLFSSIGPERRWE